MKKIAMIMAVLSLAAVFTACGDKADSGSDAKNTTAQTTAKDTEEAVDNEGEEPAVGLSGINVGDNVEFGHFPGATDWTVLDKQDGKVLLLSNHITGEMPFNVEKVETNWEQCTLRKWLNEDYFDEAFSPAEKLIILTTDLENADCNGNEQPATQDKVFLLSHPEMVKYEMFDNEDILLAKNSVGNPAQWWLRTIGYNANKNAVTIESSGSIYFNGYTVNKEKGVRPAIWVQTAD